MPRRRLILALLLGLLTTLVVCWALPLLLTRLSSSRWANFNIPPVPGSGIQFQGLSPWGALPASPLDIPLSDEITTQSRDKSPGLLPTWPARSPDPDAWMEVTTRAYGWPFRALAAEFWNPGPTNLSDGSTPPLKRSFRFALQLDRDATFAALLPLRPIWPGLIADTVLYAVLWYPILLIPILRPSWWAAGRRLRRGRCPACSYDLQWNFAPGCPECGWRRSSTGFQPVSPASPAPSGGGGRVLEAGGGREASGSPHNPEIPAPREVAP